MVAPLKSLTVNAYDRCSADDSNGFVRSDVLLHGLQLPCDADSLYKFLDDRGLWSVMPAAEGLHFVINHSVSLRARLALLLPARVMEALNGELLAETGLPFDRKLHMGWHWRLLWSAVDVFERHLRSDFPQLFILVQTFARVIPTVYAPASRRTAKSLLHLVANAFVHASVWRKLSGKQQLATHFMWPHIMFTYHDLPLSFMLSESTESVFRIFRRIEQTASFHSPGNRIKELMQRYLAYVAVRQAERQTSTLKNRPPCCW
jgi:hypothetical protein